MLTLAVPEHIRWARESDGLLVVDEHRLIAHRLTGLEAIIWEEMARPYPDLARWLAALLDVPPAAAEKRLMSVFESWQRAGLLIQVHDG